MKFKVGDRVRVVRESLSHGAKEGMTGLIVVKTGKCFGVRFDNAFADGHSLYGECEDGYGQWMVGEDLELIGDNHKIVIISDGKTTLARLYEGKKVVKHAQAKCSPDDEFDFTKGAKIAFERLSNSSKKIVEGERYKIIGNGGNDGNGLRHGFKIGDVVICKAVDGRSSCYFHTGSGLQQWVSDEDVEPVIEPKYYSGKLVCVKSNCNWWTAGKVYEFVNGKVFDDECVERERILDVADMNDKMYGCARFIELKE